MRLIDVGRFAWRSLSGYRTRSLLMILAMSIGVGAVVVLTALGEGARRYVRNQFQSLGTNLVIVFPGHAETVGGSGGLLSGRTPRDLTLDDAMALERIRGVRTVVPLNIAAGEIWWSGRSRDVPTVGATRDLQQFWNLKLAEGQFLPAQSPRVPTTVCIIGWKVRRELFGSHAALGEWTRVGDRRFRVIGVIATTGQRLGLDFDELVIIPIASAQALFNLRSLLRIGVETQSREDVPRVASEVRRTLRQRHEGEEDVTVVTEDAVATTFDRILVALTLALGGIASISLAVAGILIMNVMLIAVSQRTSEIGLLKAIGASPAQIRALFFAEAGMLSVVGAVVGTLLGMLGSLAIRQAYPTLPAYTPPWAVVAAFGTALTTGILFSVLPARRAAGLEAAAALARR